MALSLAPFASVTNAHETDQFTLPAGREFADIGDELTITAYTAIEKGVNKINGRIKGESDAGRTGEEHHTPDAVAAAVNSQFPPAMFLIDDYDKRVLLPGSKMNYPGKLVGYKPSSSVRKYVNVPLSPFNAWECATIQAYGVTFGTDKIGHFTDMGMHYFRAYRKALKAGANEQDAMKKAVYLGTDEFIFAESGLLGWRTAGGYSNADLVANFMGFMFYRNLTEPVMLKGAQRPPMLVRDGAYWRIAPHVRSDSQFFSLFFSEHLDESLNPSNYIPNMRKGIRRAIEEYASSAIQRHVDANGNRRSQQYFRDKLAELSTYWAVDYGHNGSATDVMSIANVCFGKPLPQDAPPTARDRVGRTALHVAAERGDVATIDRLLQGGADVNVQVRSDEKMSSEWGNTPLHSAARDGQAAAAALLLDRGANINARNDRGVTPLHRSISHPKVTQLLIARGAGIDATDNQGRTALHWAANDPQSKSTDVLLASKAPVNARDVDGQTALHRAALAGNVVVMQALLAAGADINAADKTGVTALHLGARTDDPRAASLLVRGGADVNARDQFGCTPMHDATHARNTDVIALLVGARANPAVANAYGVTPMQLAERSGRTAIAGIMKGAPADAAVAATEAEAEIAAEKQGPDPAPAAAKKAAMAN